MTIHLPDFPTSAELFEKELEEQRTLYRALSRSIDELAHRGEDPPAHWRSVHSELSDHFVALSQGR